MELLLVIRFIQICFAKIQILFQKSKDLVEFC